MILLPVLLLLLLSSSVASERERTEENKQTKNRRKQMTIARLITKELTTPQLLATPNLHSKKEWQKNHTLLRVQFVVDKPKMS